jgi:outer membrane protein TolC
MIVRWWWGLAFPCLVFADTLSLADAVRVGLANNYAIAIARNDQEKAQNTRKLKYGALFPTVRGDGSVSHVTTDPSAAMDGTAASGSVSLNWTLFDGFRMFYGISQIEAQAQYTEQAARYQIEASVMAIITAYYSFLAAVAMRDAACDQLAISQKLLARGRDQLELGGISSRGLLRQQVVVNEDSAVVLSRMLDVVEARQTLNVAIGRSPAALIDIVTDTTAALPQHDAAFWYDNARNYNAGLRMADIRQRIAVSEQGIAKAAFWPVLAASGAYTKSFGVSDQDRMSAGLSLSWQIFNGFRNLTTAQNAHLSVKNAELSFEQEQKLLEAHIYAQWERQQNAYHQVLLERQSVTYAGQSLDVSREQYAMGGIADLQLREAQLAISQAVVRLQSALFQYKITTAQLEQLAGMLKID